MDLEASLSRKGSHTRSFTNYPQALTPLTPASSSSLSSASSLLSRQSSCRSTASVSAVPFRTPIRGPASSTGMSRQGSGGIGRGFDSTGLGSQTSYFPNSSGERLSRSAASSVGAVEETKEQVARLSLSDSPVAAATQENGDGQAEGAAAPTTAATEALIGARPGVIRRGSSADVALRKTIQDFKKGEIIGEGSYSTVISVTDTSPPHKKYALKMLNKAHILREKKTKYVLIERDTMKKLDGHPGIVRLYWTFQDNNSLYYVLELATNGELLKWIQKFGSFAIPSARFYAAQLLSAVEHMHAHGVIHRDLKPENILLDDNMRFKVTDFGTAKQLDEDKDTDGIAPVKARTRSFVGTPEYVSPEILSEGKESSKSSDYWGFGCILFQIIAGRPPFQATTEYLMFQKIIKLDYEFPAGFPDDAKDLVKKLLIVDPTKRLGGSSSGIEEIKAHPFFAGVDFSTIWTVEPPKIETGLRPPRPEERGEFVMPPGLDTFDMDENEDDEGEDANDDEDGSSRPSSGSVDRARWSGASGNGISRGEGSIPFPSSSRPSSTTSEPVTKWTGVLRARETIVLASPVLEKSGFLGKSKRTLILTDAPRLICIKETPTKVSVKSEVFLTKIGDKRLEGLAKAELVDDKTFVIKTTSQRSFKYEDPAGLASRWVNELTETHAQS